jgi:hypothetical protein
VDIAESGDDLVCYSWRKPNRATRGLRRQTAARSADRRHRALTANLKLRLCDPGRFSLTQKLPSLPISVLTFCWAGDIWCWDLRFARGRLIAHSDPHLAVMVSRVFPICPGTVEAVAGVFFCVLAFDVFGLGDLGDDGDLGLRRDPSFDGGRRKTDQAANAQIRRALTAMNQLGEAGFGHPEERRDRALIDERFAKGPLATGGTGIDQHFHFLILQGSRRIMKGTKSRTGQW